MIKTHLSLVLVDGFLQSQHRPMSEEYDISVTILILVDGFLQYCQCVGSSDEQRVTILILVDGFLQFTIPLGLDS